MQLLCIAALLLSAVAAQQDEMFQPGDGEQSVTQAPEDGDGGSGGNWPQWKSDHPVWKNETPPGFQNRPTARPGNGNPQGPMKGSDRQPGRPQGSPRGKRQFPGFGVPHPGPMGHFGKPPRGNGRPNKTPGPMVFSPVFKLDNVTFENITDVTLEEGENIFLKPMHGGRGHHHHHHHHQRGGKHGPPENGQYVKLIYNSTEPNTVSIEFGVVTPPGETGGE